MNELNKPSTDEQPGIESYKATIAAMQSELEQLHAKYESLLLDRHHLNTLMEHLPDSIYFKDAQSHFIRVNNAWSTRRHLAKPTDAINKSDFDFFSKELADSFFADEHKILTTGKALIGKVEKIESTGKETRWVSITKIPVTDPESGTIIGTCGISHDISFATRIEEELAKERDILHMLLDNSPDAIYFKDRESNFIRISRAQARMFHLKKPEEAIGKSDFDFFPIEHAQEAYNDEQRIVSTGKPVVGKIECETAPGMPERWVFTTKMPMCNRQGDIFGTFGISRDITEIKQYENALRSAKNDLEERVRKRTEDLQLANTSLETRISQLDFLNAASYEMAQRTDLKKLASTILKTFVSRLTRAVASFNVKTETGFSCIEASDILSPVKNHGASELALALLHADTITQPTMIENWRESLPVDKHPFSQLSDLPCCIIIPLLADNRYIGTILLFAGEGSAARFAEDEKVLRTLATHAAVSLSNTMYYQELGEKARLQGELDAARSIQQRLTPSCKPSIPRINLKGLYYPAYEVGGDYLDYFKNDAGCWVVVIADVCGKGVPAALLMTILRSAFRVDARTETSAKNLLCSVNNSMMINLDDRSFVTAICLIINPNGTLMSYARAGHPRLIKISAGSNQVHTFESDGIALGILPDPESFAHTITEQTLPLIAGDRYFIYTDGLTEAFDNHQNAYTTKRLLDFLGTDIGTSPEAILSATMTDIKSFTQGAPYHDDLTIIALEVTDAIQDEIAPD